MNKRKKGFALITVLIFFLVLLVLGVGGAIITQMGYFSIASEAKYTIAEKRANKGLLKVLENGTCENYQETGINVIAIKDSGNNYCFVWSKGRYLGAKVIKTSIFPLKASNWSAAMFKNLDIENLSLEGNSAIVGYDSPENSCDDPNSCIAPALVTGNNINPKNIVIACNTKENNLGSGLVSTVDPYIYDETLSETDLTSKLFNAENRVKLLESLSNNFNVEFDNGTPRGLKNAELSLDVNNCTASGNTITCGTGENADVFTWDPIKKVYKYNKDNNEYSKIDFGQNAKITFSNNFSGGGYIAGRDITFSGSVNSDSSLVLVARNETTISQNNINIYKTFIFSQNYNIDAQNLTIGNGIIYSGGAGVGNLNINVNSNTQIGTKDYPILIISDNNINIKRNGNAEIWGVIFVTDANNDFSLGSGSGNFKIHGVIISNSLNNNNINLTGKFEIRFNFKVLERLYSNLNQLNLNLLNFPICGASKKKLFITTTTRAY